MIPKQLYHRNSRPRIGDDVPISTSIKPSALQMPASSKTAQAPGAELPIAWYGVQGSGCEL